MPASSTNDNHERDVHIAVGALKVLIGVAVGLGDVWRFLYMVGKFGGATFVLFYVLIVVLIGIPALMAECALGRHARRGPVGAFATKHVRSNLRLNVGETADVEFTPAGRDTARAVMRIIPAHATVSFRSVTMVRITLALFTSR